MGCANDTRCSHHSRSASTGADWTRSRIIGAPRYITLDRPEKPRYYTEAWQLTDGAIVFAVAHNNGRSMDHHTGKIEDLTLQAWGVDAAVLETTIILDWRDAKFLKDRLRVLVRNGLSDVFDEEAWRARGVVFGALL